MTSKNNLISIVIPAYNEYGVVQSFHDSLLAPSIEGINYEVIYVNDGSTDKTLNELHAIAQKDKRVKVVNLSKNFGKEIAVTAGIHQSSGSATIILDSDGQHPPHLIPQFIEKWKNGAQVVIGIRNKQQHESLIKKFGSKAFYRIFNGLTGTRLIPRSTDYRLIDKAIRVQFIKMNERSRITRGLIDWLGFKRDYITFDSPERIAGEASYSTKSLVKLAVNSFTSLSLKPLFIFGWVGAFLMTISITLGLFVVIEQFVLGDPLMLNISGAAILSIFILFLVSIMLISQSMLSIYIAHIHEQSQGRPLFVIDETGSINLKNE